VTLMQVPDQKERQAFQRVRWPDRREIADWRLSLDETWGPTL